VLCEFEIDPTARFHGELGRPARTAGQPAGERLQVGALAGAADASDAQPGSPQRAGLLISVEDDGPGIPPEKVEHLLQRGVRGDERVQGHGIGLAIVQDIVRAYRGELSVERSEELGGARASAAFRQAPARPRNGIR
jgi:two-component system, OmpR family, sensor histidine kinase PhoQ